MGVWKICIGYGEFGSFLIFRGFFDEINDDSNEYDVFLLYNEICWYLEDLFS